MNHLCKAAKYKKLREQIKNLPVEYYFSSPSAVKNKNIERIIRETVEPTADWLSRFVVDFEFSENVNFFISDLNLYSSDILAEPAPVFDIFGTTILVIFTAKCSHKSPCSCGVGRAEFELYSKTSSNKIINMLSPWVSCTASLFCANYCFRETTQDFHKNDQQSLADFIRIAISKGEPA